MSNRYTIDDENSRGMCDFYDNHTSEVLEGTCVVETLNEHENLLMKFQLMQADNKRLQADNKRLQAGNKQLRDALEGAATHIKFVNDCVMDLNWATMALAIGTLEDAKSALRDSE
ncbi:MAG: hypothetical protein GY938_16970 [Ketobacter sp.]|nr:hypothetical protein [Ketobacter sp.]